MAQFADFAFGPYTATWNASALGLTDGPIRLQKSIFGQPIKCDRYGQTTVGGIYLGQDVFVSLIIKEWNSTIRGIIFNHSGGATGFGDAGLIGRPMEETSSGLSAQLVLTAVTGTPAATHGPATITAPRATLAEGQNLEFLLGNVERNIPLIFRLFPAETTGGSGLMRFFTTT